VIRPIDVVRCVLIAAVLAAGTTSAQESYPDKPIRFISPYAPGGSTTVVAHFIAQKLTESWGQQVLVENRSGGNTVIGTDAVAKSAADGYTVLVAASDHILVPLLFKVPYDPIKDFAPVATLANGQLVLVLNPLVPANNLKEFLAYAKSKPGQLNFGTPGAGGLQHLAHELLNLTAGIKTQHVPYKGGGPAIIDLIGGSLQFYLGTSASVVPHIKSGKIKAIAVSGKKRLPALPQVPTFTEAGLAGFEVEYWNGVLAPAATPRAIVEKLSAQIAKILVLPDFKEMLAGQGVEPFINTPDQYAAVLKADMAKYAKIIKDANIKMEY